MHRIVWEYEVLPLTEERFVDAYGSDGDWAQLFARAPGFLGTRLYRDVDDPRRWLTVDHWVDAAAWHSFGATHAEEYAALDRACQALTVAERRLVPAE